MFRVLTKLGSYFIILLFRLLATLTLMYSDRGQMDHLLKIKHTVLPLQCTLSHIVQTKALLLALHALPLQLRPMCF